MVLISNRIISIEMQYLKPLDSVQIKLLMVESKYLKSFHCVQTKELWLI